MEEKDREIVALVTQKNYDGLEKMIDCYGGTILRTIRYILNHPTEHSYLKEAENEVFYKLWQVIPQYQPEKSSLKTWIITITKNVALDKKRKIIRELKIIPTESIPEEFAEEDYFKQEDFLNLLHALSTEDQLIFLKYYYFQDKPQDIATDLDLATDIIYNRLSRGRKKLKRTLTQSMDS